MQKNVGRTRREGKKKPIANTFALSFCFFPSLSRKRQTACIIVKRKDDSDKFAAVRPEDFSSSAPPPSKDLPQPPSPPPASSAEGRVVASPFARKVADEQGVSLSGIQGTGPNNRIIAADVMEYAGAAKEARPAVVTQAYTDIPNSNIRKVTARRLTESKQTIPHYYLTIDCHVDKLEKMREELNTLGGGAYKLSLNDFIIKASALVLKKVPVVNSQWSGDFIRRFHNVDINVAVNTEQGLFTPFVADADKKGLVDISNKVKELAKKAKENALKPQDFQGGTFTISNLGMFGISQFAAVINPPQAAILAVGSGEKKPVVEEVEEEKGKKKQIIRVRSVMSVTLSCDHRVVDGAVGAQWLQQFKKYIEDPQTMLL